MSLDTSIPQKMKNEENFIILDTSIPKKIKEDKKDESVLIWLRKKKNRVQYRTKRDC